MTPSNRLEKAILELWPIALWRESTIVVAASGGADSTALLEILFQIRPDPDRTIAAHYNHALRGEESDADQAFVFGGHVAQPLAKNLGVSRLASG